MYIINSVSEIITYLIQYDWISIWESLFFLFQRSH